MAGEAITQRSGLALGRAIRAGELSSRQVVEEHIGLLRRLEPALGAIAVDRYDAALEEADAADARIAAAADGEELPPYLGVPCTVKESIGFEGMPNTAGVVARRGTLAPQSAPTTQRLLDLGAIPLGVTNTSELTMWIESVNRVYGRTNNAYDAGRTAGGSSGGEGAVVGSGGAPIGLGSDIGGSIRLPAFFNGVFGHKCTAHLVPNSGQWPEAIGEPTRMLAVGPIVRRAEDLMPVLSAIAGPDGTDPDTREVALGDPADVELSGLPVIIGQDITPPKIARELLDVRERAAGALAAAGASVRTESLKSIRRAMEYYLATLASGEVEEVWIQVGGTPGTRAPLRRIIGDAVRGRGDHTVALAILLAVERMGDRIPDKRNAKAVEAGRALAREVEDTIGDGVLLHPPFGRVAPKHGRTVGKPWVILPAAIFNLMGLPATEIPLGLNPEGLPLGVQAVAGRDRDHVSIAVALELERVFGGWVPPHPA
ncbi:MAG TPA: amidase [Thermoleophilaceae bacterium]|nr:amidase [Thermoleophilaceae bacterium]